MKNVLELWCLALGCIWNCFRFEIMLRQYAARRRWSWGASRLLEVQTESDSVSKKSKRERVRP